MLQAQAANPLRLLKYPGALHSNILFSHTMAFFLVTWKADNSVSIIKRNVKALLSLEGKKVKFRWPRKGVYTGTDCH